jgi:hypothetical protein
MPPNNSSKNLREWQPIVPEGWLVGAQKLICCEARVMRITFVRQFPVSAADAWFIPKAAIKILKSITPHRGFRIW